MAAMCMDTLEGTYMACRSPINADQVGEDLFLRLVSLNPEFVRDDYYSDDGWDMDAMREDIKSMEAHNMDHAAQMFQELCSLNSIFEKRDYFDNEEGWDVDALRADLHLVRAEQAAAHLTSTRKYTRLEGDDVRSRTVETMYGEGVIEDVCGPTGFIIKLKGSGATVYAPNGIPTQQVAEEAARQSKLAGLLRQQADEVAAMCAAPEWEVNMDAMLGEQAESFEEMMREVMDCEAAKTAVEAFVVEPMCPDNSQPEMSPEPEMTPEPTMPAGGAAMYTPTPATPVVKTPVVEEPTVEAPAVDSSLEILPLWTRKRVRTPVKRFSAEATPTKKARKAKKKKSVKKTKKKAAKKPKKKTKAKKTKTAKKTKKSKAKKTKRKATKAKKASKKTAPKRKAAKKTAKKRPAKKAKKSARKTKKGKKSN